MVIQRIVRISLSLGLVLIFLLHSSNFSPILLLHRLENLAYDFRLRLTMPNTVDPDIVILDIDERSLAEVGRWPWPRNTLAKIIDNLFELYQINVVGFDVVFAEADESSGLKVLESMAKGNLEHDEAFLDEYNRIRASLENDRIFAASLRNRKVVLGYVFLVTQDESQTNRTGKLPPPVGHLEANFKGKIDLNTNIDYTANLGILQDAAYNAGFFDNPIVDDDGIFRRVPLLQVYDDKIYQSLALAVTRAALSNPDIQINIETDDVAEQNYYAIETVSLGDRVIPVDGETGVLVPYRGAKGKFQYISMVDVLKGTVDVKALQNKIVLVGTTAAGLLDLRSTPVEEIFPGVEVHANIISGILDNRIAHRPQFTLGYEIITALSIGLLMSFLLPFISPFVTLMVTLGIMGLLTGSNIYAWNEWGLVLPISTPLLLTLSVFVLNMSYGFFVESRSKRQLSKRFGQYIPPELVDEMSRNPQEESMESQSKELTVLFSDVRGFTTISESLEPNELSRLINAFLTPMTQIIHKHRGTIDKYMGDAIMAFWGAPLDDEFHARNALLAAMDMVKRLNELKPEFDSNGWPPINVGVGLNTGEMRVGDMGSEFRRAYTVMGDAVNLGSRLEALTKKYQATIICNETTKHAVPEFEYRELDYVQVKGKDKPVAIFEPLGPIEEISKDTKKELRRYHQALKYYRKQEWDAAERELFSLANANKACHVYQMYVDRIMHFRSEPPGKEWDGVFTHDSK